MMAEIKMSVGTLADHALDKLKELDIVPVVRCSKCKYAREPQRNCREEADACEGVLICENGADTVFEGEIGWKFVNDDFFLC